MAQSYSSASDTTLPKGTPIPAVLRWGEEVPRQERPCGRQRPAGDMRPYQGLSSPCALVKGRGQDIKPSTGLYGSDGGEDIQQQWGLYPPSCDRRRAIPASSPYTVDNLVTPRLGGGHGDGGGDACHTRRVKTKLLVDHLARG